jgi:alkanesulfonate monooxygenase SsuD/methylene tetrahydromethanopterin reductase-like flavin-dependent oxidoreductase (luciferase family)
MILGVSMDGVGAHPAAWRLPGVADKLLDPGRLVDLAHTAERADIDFVSLEDSFDPQAFGLPFRFDALLSLAHVAAATTTVGLVATVTVTHTEPFHVSKNIATLDLVSAGRAGWRVAVSTTPEAARRFGRRDSDATEELLAEADDAVEVVGRLWDSWEDDAVIRDRATGRYIDRNKLHYINFDGPYFSVRGPSITPRPPQGQPIVVIDVDGPGTVDLAGRRADVAVLHVGDPDAARALAADVRAAAVAAGRPADDVKVLATVRIGEEGLRRRLDALLGDEVLRRPAFDLVGDPEHVTSVLTSWFSSGAVDGFVLEPDALPDTLDWIVDDVAGALRARGVRGTDPGGGTLRGRFGLERPANRYALAEVGP